MRLARSEWNALRTTEETERLKNSTPWRRSDRLPTFMNKNTSDYY